MLAFQMMQYGKPIGRSTPPPRRYRTIRARSALHEAGGPDSAAIFGGRWTRRPCWRPSQTEPPHASRGMPGYNACRGRLDLTNLLIWREPGFSSGGAKRPSPQHDRARLEAKGRATMMIDDRIADKCGQFPLAPAALLIVTFCTCRFIKPSAGSGDRRCFTAAMDNFVGRAPTTNVGALQAVKVASTYGGDHSLADGLQPGERPRIKRDRDGNRQRVDG